MPSQTISDYTIKQSYKKVNINIHRYARKMLGIYGFSSTSLSFFQLIERIFNSTNKTDDRQKRPAFIIIHSAKTNISLL